MRFLKFDNTIDFPFYNHNPKISKTGWFVLLLSVVLAFFSYMIIGLFSEFVGSIIFCLIMLIPLLYFSNWNYSLMFRRPSRNEIILAVIMFAGYIIYAIVIDAVLVDLGVSYADAGAPYDVNFEEIISLIFSMMGEELVKFIPLMFFLRLFFKYTNDRKLSISISAAIIMIGFGLLHYDPTSSSIASVLLIQGLGSIFEIYGYLKTKNIYVSYMSHFLTDMFLYIGVFLGFG